MQRILLIGFAGLAGTLGRYFMSGLVARRFGETFPVGTIIINVIGCFLAGLLFYVLQERSLVSETVRLAIMVGFLGGFTTFSAYGLQTFTLFRDGEVFLAFLNLAISNVLGLFMVWLGFVAARAVMS
ncbi:MAG TPA: fluoride efflux transporter CrcB [Pyrinomonadaceae bacterium]|jgi:CrcB protein|nr:fluoride efflux transporter CrcB [Pyrinomonadaceae bacterium]